MQLHDSFGGITRPWVPRKSTNEDHSPGLDEKQRFRKGFLRGRNLNHYVHWSNLYICLGLCVTCYCTFKIFSAWGKPLLLLVQSQQALLRWPAQPCLYFVLQVLAGTKHLGKPG